MLTVLHSSSVPDSFDDVLARSEHSSGLLQPVIEPDSARQVDVLVPLISSHRSIGKRPTFEKQKKATPDSLNADPGGIESQCVGFIYHSV